MEDIDIQFVHYKLACGYELTEKEQFWWNENKDRYEELVESIKKQIVGVGV